jgi:hypothetical protein
MVTIHELVQPVNGILQNLFNQHSQPQAIELREKTCENSKCSRNLAEFCLKAPLFFRNVHFNFIKGKTQVLKEHLLNQHIDFSDSLKDENQQKESTHVPPKRVKKHFFTEISGS